jgi:bla regulator protein blaR1
MEMIANTLLGVGNVGRPGLDRTGLSGTFDFYLEWTPQLNDPLPPGSTIQPDESGPTFLEALKDQLGLKLEPQTGPVDVLVVDHVEEPSPN